MTAALPNSHPYINEAYESLCLQELPGEWTWEWILQEDGLPSALPDEITTDDRVKLASNDPNESGEPSGPGITRNIALSRSAGELIRVLDSDDVLVPGALAREISVLEAFSDVGWTTCQVLDLHADGSTTPYDNDPPGGRLERQSVGDMWLQNNQSPVHPGTLCVRRKLLVAAGGWMALPTGEDSGLLATLNEYSDGWFIDQPGMLYRQHDNQITKSDLHLDPELQELRWRTIADRIKAIRQLLAGGF
ncbi:glycosyltransferase family 2 protein [Nocardia arthritidis]|uniref:glycosyltransferase family 2 protein n=1 Tax=Nocardia arthritidis TaxID=228602 RepID=UPI00142DDDD1|nr:glycosyltransferase family 2 protein [Nocardia arthritidis]